MRPREGRRPLQKTNGIIWKLIYPAFALACLAWLILRSGRKPSRLRYPCQQAALVNSTWILAGLGIGSLHVFRRLRVRTGRLLPIITIAAMCGLLALNVPALAPAAAAFDIAAARERAASFEPAVWQGAEADGSHDVYMVSKVPGPQGAHHPGVDSLIRYMGEGGLDFYKSAADYPGAGLDGLIGKDDVVLLKVNAAWDQRGMTNTDVVKGLITAVLAHPEGFTGEVVIVENCEGGPDYTQALNNAENTGQSFQSVISSFGDPGRVSSSSWWSFTDNLVHEYNAGDFRQGYVWLGNNVAYPKFATGRGTNISLRYGIWTGSGYDKSRLKLINVPVLKSHNAMGVTGCCKNYMGVQSTHLTSNVHLDLMAGGFMGRLMNETIYPTLNILDAIWVSPSHPDGPAGPYSKAVRTNILLAGTDPVALDWYAAKHVLYPVSGYGRHDPDTPYGESSNPYHDGSTNTGYPYNALRLMLDSTASVLAQGGHDATSDPARIGVHLRDLREGLDWSGGHCVTGVKDAGTSWNFAEGTTREGFDEWLCLQNPGNDPGQAQLSFMTGTGEVIPYSADLAPHSRTTLHVNHILGPGKDVSVSINSTLPIICERPMYFLYQGVWSGGHCVTGVKDAGTSWNFAEGTTREGFDEWLCLQNPGNDPGQAQLSFMTGTGEVIPYSADLAPHSRTTLHVNHILGPGKDVSVSINSTLPIICERPMYFLYQGVWSGGHCVTGVKDAGTSWNFAEGTTREGFDEWLCLQNPGNDPGQAQLSFMTGTGEVIPYSADLAPHSRTTLHVNHILGPGKDVSVSINSTLPIICERPMYFLYQGVWSGGHCVTGVKDAGTSWNFAEGTTREGFDEWLCLQNPGNDPGQAQLSFMTGTGEVIPYSADLAPHSRTTLHVNHILGPGKDVSVSINSTLPIICERPMYFSRRM